MAKTRTRNARLAETLGAAGWSYSQLAAAFVRVALENNAPEFRAVSRAHIGTWVGGTIPSGKGPVLLAETLGRRLGRTVTLAEIGLSPAGSEGEVGVVWDTDTLLTLADLGRHEVRIERRQVLGATAYQLALLTLPPADWWTRMANRPQPERSGTGPLVGRGDIDAVREMSVLFSQLDQRRGGGHGRTVVHHYLTTEVAHYLHGRFTDMTLRRSMFSAASELAYVGGWMSFDAGEHGEAQRYFASAVKLAAEADDAPLTGHILRAMAHQANDLGHHRLALKVATASIEGDRYRLAGHRERALLGVVHARTLASTGDTGRAAQALLRAEDELSRASDGEETPARVAFFAEAALAHETAATLRDSNDLEGATTAFQRSVRTRDKNLYPRTHAVTLGYLGAIQAQQGAIEQACATWDQALDLMDGIRSGRTVQAVQQMRTALSPFRQRGVQAVAHIEARATAYLAHAG